MRAGRPKLAECAAEARQIADDVRAGRLDRSVALARVRHMKRAALDTMRVLCLVEQSLEREERSVINIAGPRPGPRED